jgi:hypothetical protein
MGCVESKRKSPNTIDGPFRCVPLSIFLSLASCARRPFTKSIIHAYELVGAVAVSLDILSQQHRPAAMSDGQAQHSRP